MAASLKYSKHHYGAENVLQNLGVWEVDASNDRSKYWVIYIHGGAWRDPTITHESFVPTIDHILATTPDSKKSLIAGFAAIDYRLSAHPRFPQDPSTTPPAEYRGAKHPDHINDVRSALVYLQQTYGFGSNYVLLGHSAGASMCFQLLSSSKDGATGVAVTDTKEPALPRAMVPFCGLYDFAGINARFDGQYAVFFNGAFGDSPEDWAAGCPIEFSGNYVEKWPGKSFLLLGLSPTDSLVDEPETQNMARRLREKDRFTEGGGDHEVLVLSDLVGDHDELWQSGEHVARMAWIALRRVP
ncbi:alpha/beta-hydrolase [Xylariaceae sp. FL1272]|nr:alpha/beta-hydrolase [Xylariaceae sp. FL1272]